jgi:hypothetical protein
MGNVTLKLRRSENRDLIGLMEAELNVDGCQAICVILESSNNKNSQIFLTFHLCCRGSRRKL